MNNMKSRYYDYDYDYNVRERHGAMPQNGRATLLNVPRLYFPHGGGAILARIFVSRTRNSSASRNDTVDS